MPAWQLVRAWTILDAMLNRLFSSRDKRNKTRGSGARRGPARVPDGLRLYAIGDIHGRLDLLTTLLSRIRADRERHGARRHKIVFLGDYVDRGPESRQVIELLCGDAMPGSETVYLVGNHEDAMLRFLDDIEVGRSWLQFGGVATLYSYGIAARPQEFDPERLQSMQLELRDALPEHHLSFLRSLETFHVEGDYLFVHAGIRPGVPIERQERDDLIWIRDEFLRSKVDHGKIVVHGHTVSAEPEICRNRIGIDTGAFMSGALTCLILQGEEQCMIHT